VEVVAPTTLVPSKLQGITPKSLERTILNPEDSLFYPSFPCIGIFKSAEHKAVVFVVGFLNAVTVITDFLVPRPTLFKFQVLPLVMVNVAPPTDAIK